MGAEIREVDAACTVPNALPKTVHSRIRRQFLMDQTYDYPETFVATIPCGRVWGPGFIITPDDQLLDDVSTDFSVVENRRSAVYNYWRLRQIEELKGTIAVLSTDAADLYYHWMFQLLPRFELIRRSGIDLRGIDYFLVNGLERKFQRETMEMLGIDRRKLIESSRLPYIRASNLIVSSNPLGGGCFPPWMCEFLRRTFLKAADGRVKPGRRLYISRGLAGYRRVLNEAQVVEFLGRHGFEEIKLEGLSVREQAAIMASCDVIVAPHGGGLSNLVFCSPGTKVIEIFSPELVAGFFWKISNQLGLDYYYILGNGQPATYEPDYQQSWNSHTDIEVDLGMLEKTLVLADVRRSVLSSNTLQ
jgi:capsular polysaccharide biosynthesis protein